MPVPAPNLRKLTDDEIWAHLSDGEVDSPWHKQCVLELQLRNLQRQTEASRYLVTWTESLATYTRNLAAATDRLVTATWVLAALSGLLLIVTIVQAVRSMMAA